MKQLDINEILNRYETLINASLDAVCVVDSDAKIVYANSMMKNFLSLKPRELSRNPVFCELIKLSVCDKTCQVKSALENGKSIRFDEAPGVLKGNKLRVNFKITPFSIDGVVGAIICLRDTTAELLTQAKYSKLLSISKKHEDQIEYHKDLLRKIRGTR